MNLIMGSVDDIPLNIPSGSSSWMILEAMAAPNKTEQDIAAIESQKETYWAPGSAPELDPEYGKKPPGVGAFALPVAAGLVLFSFLN